MSIGRARTLRQTSTDAERLLWGALLDRRLNGLKFRRQHAIGPYVADFICLDCRLIVELDGGQHSAQVDARRTEFLEQAGFRVLRFWNPEVLTKMDTVLETILAAAEGRL